MNKVIAYGCVTSGFHSTKSADKISEDDAQWRLSTKVADEIRKLRNLFVAEDIIKIDVIDSTRRHRKHFENALKTMGHGDTIIIASLNALGTNNDEVVKNFKRIYNKKIGLLLPNYENKNGLSIFATTDFGFSPVSIGDDEFSILCNKLALEEIESYRGRKKIGISKEFKQVYWDYERYLIDPTTSCKNCFFCISKNTFRRLCEEYEKSSEYISDLEEQESLYNVHQLPKRFGKINDDMVDMINTVAQGVSFEDACVMHHIEVNLIHFMRLFAKHLTPKKLIISLTNKHRDYELIESLQPRYDKTS